MEEFIKKAIGVPWIDKGRQLTGWDCWGLVVHFYKEIFGIDLRIYEDVSFCSGSKKGSLRTVESEARFWSLYPIGEERIGDVALFRPLHSGIVIGNNKMLHCEVGTNTCIERYRSRLWENRLIGFYRHENLR